MTVFKSKACIVTAEKIKNLDLLKHQISMQLAGPVPGTETSASSLSFSEALPPLEDWL